MSTSKWTDVADVAVERSDELLDRRIVPGLALDRLLMAIASLGLDHRQARGTRVGLTGDDFDLDTGVKMLSDRRLEFSAGLGVVGQLTKAKAPGFAAQLQVVAVETLETALAQQGV